MKGNTKGPAPDVLTDWWIPYGGLPAPPSWGELQNPQKHELKIALLKEQRYVCVYCGKAITARPGSSHIEHFWPQSKFSNLRFEWANLFVSCGPTGKTNTPIICGDAKGDWTPADHIEPTDPQCEQKFSYDGNGAISPSVIGGKQAGTMIEKLNLDCPSLDYERLSIVADLERRIRAGEIDASNKAAEIALWRSADASGKLIGYGHVAARYLENEPL